MRVQLTHIVVLVGVALTPVVGEASPITTESMVPSGAGASSANERSGGTSSAHGWSGPEFSSLVDASGDPILVLSSFNAFDPPGDHNKLRGGRGGGIFFAPTGGSSSWGGFGGSGSWGGGTPPGLPGPGSFTLLSMSPPGGGPDPDPELNLNLGAGSGSGLTLSFEQCCEGDGDTAAVPEPSTLLLVGSGLAIGLARLRRSARARSIES